MFIIEYTTPALSLDGDLDLELNSGLEVITFDRSTNGLILIEGTSPLATGGQLDIAELAGRPGQPMVVEAFSIATTAAAGVTGTVAIRTPLEPGNADNANRDTATLFTFTTATAITELPVLVPALHRFAIDIPANGPVRIILQCRELQSGEFQNNWVERQLVN